MSIAAENLPLPHRDDKKEKLPRWFSEKCFEFHGFDYLGLELSVLISEIHRVLEYCICGY
jgi:hypothetical protein